MVLYHVLWLFSPVFRLGNEMKISHVAGQLHATTRETLYTNILKIARTVIEDVSSDSRIF